jgi:hypothetical protein
MSVLITQITFHLDEHTDFRLTFAQPMALLGNSVTEVINVGGNEENLENNHAPRLRRAPRTCRLASSVKIHREDRKCAVCLSEMTESRVVYTGACTRHFVCGGCMRGMRAHHQNGKCPTCRTSGELKKIVNWRACLRRSEE